MKDTLVRLKSEVADYVESLVYHKDDIHKLHIVAFDNDLPNRLYLNSISKHLTSLDMEAEVTISNDLELIETMLYDIPSGTKVLVLQSKSNYDLYDVAKSITIGTGIDVEGPTQAPVIDAVDSYVKALTGNNSARIAIFGRSATLGLPLAMKLIERNHTITVFHSQSGEYNLDNIDYVISAMGGVEHPAILNQLGKLHGVIDIGRDFIGVDSDKIVSNIGSITTDYLIGSLSWYFKPI